MPVGGNTAQVLNHNIIGGVVTVHYALLHEIGEGNQAAGPVIIGGGAVSLRICG